MVDTRVSMGYAAPFDHGVQGVEQGPGPLVPTGDIGPLRPVQRPGGGASTSAVEAQLHPQAITDRLLMQMRPPAPADQWWGMDAQHGAMYAAVQEIQAQKQQGMASAVALQAEAVLRESLQRYDLLVAHRHALLPG